LRDVLDEHNVVVESVELGRAVVLIDQERFDRAKINAALARYGLGLIESADQMVVEEIKKAVVDLIHRLNNVNSIVQKSDYLVEKLGMSYQKLSRLFSQYEPITLEKYIINNKIERIKELIDLGEFTLSEISYMMDYSSVHYLSSQFKKITGYSVSDYKTGVKGKREPVIKA
jgi:YesN/AraC family two-component response regulator